MANKEIFGINKKGLEDSVFTWIIVFFMLVFIMVIYIIFMLSIFGKEKLTGIDVTFKEEELDLDSNLKLINFLNSKIIVDGEEKKLIGAIKSSLSPYFEIENNKGENFVEKYGLNAFSKDAISLKRIMIADGFDNSDWDKLIKTGLQFERSNTINSIIKELDKICNIDKTDRYFLELPQGTITEAGLKIQDFFTPSNLDYTDNIIHKTNYKGESLEIKFRMRKECVENFN